MRPRRLAGRVGRRLNLDVGPQEEMALSPVVVKRFIDRFPSGGGDYYSIRRRADGLFQLYHDQPDLPPGLREEIDDHRPIPGIYAEQGMVEAELLTMRPNVELLP
jgi:hypothetical protein